MSVELTKDERDIKIAADGKYHLSAYQEQVYDPENVQAMLADWDKKETEIKAWLDKYDQNVKDGIELLNKQMELQKQRVLAELASIVEGRKMWKNARRESEGSNPVSGNAKNKG